MAAQRLPSRVAIVALSALVFGTLLFAAEARAHHGVRGWYAGARIGLLGPTLTDAGACAEAHGEWRGEQISDGIPWQSWINSLLSVSGGVCSWYTDGGVTGPYGQVAWHDSKYDPVPPFTDPGNLGDPGSGGACLEGNPVSPVTGNKFQKEVDYVAYGPFPLRFARYFNSFSNQGRAGLGVNWTHSYGQRLRGDGPNIMVAFRENGRSLRFVLTGGLYVADSTERQRLERITSPALGWKLTTEDDEVEMYDDSGKLLSVSNRAGLTHTLTYATDGTLSSVTDSFGQTLSFTWTGGMRIQSIAAAPGTVSYGYGGSSFRNLISVTYPGGAARTYHYENSSFPSKLTGITDENGNRFSTYTYDANGRADSTENAGGANKVTFVHDSATGTRNVAVTRFVSSTQSAARTYAFESIGGLGRRTGIFGQPGPDCGPASQTNDANANPASRVDWNSNRTDYTYDLARNLETSRTEGLTSSGATTPQTRTISTQWHATFRLPTAIAEPLRITTNVYDPDGSQCGARGALCSKSIQATTDANGSQGFGATPTGSPRTWTYTYNANGSVLTMNGPRTDVSDVTTYTYYANNASCPTTNGGHATGCRGQVETITSALSQTTSVLAYNSMSQPKHIVDPNGLVTALTYTLRGKPLTRSVGSETTTYQYDLVEQLTQVTLPDGSFLSYTYDDAHRLTEIQDNLGNRIVYTLDAMGNRTLEEVRDPANALVQTRSRVFDNLNRLFRELGAQSQTTEYAYDDQGNVLTVKDPLDRVTVNQYDALNRLKQVTSPAPISAVMQYAYNGLDALTQVTDPRSLVTGYSVDGLGNLTQQVSPDTGTTTNTYDSAGNLLTQTDAKSQTTAYAYDTLNRVTLVTFHDGSTQTYAYDQGANGIGRLFSITERNPSNQVTSAITYAYDQHGRVTSDTRSVGGTQHVTNYRYDSSGRLDQLTYPSGRRVNYGFDSLGRVSQITTTRPGNPAQTVVSAVTYHPFGRVKSYTLGNGQSYTRGIDLDGRISSYTLGNQSFALGYDAASRISFISDIGNPPNTNTYGYDDLDRLTSAVLPTTPYAYTYDAVGNRTSRTAGSSTEDYTSSATSNRVASITPASGPVRNFVFDANGSTSADGLNTYVYDVRGRMVQAASTIGATNYQVNALGQRIRKTNTLGDTVFHYDARGRLIAETEPDGALKRELIYLGDIPVGVLQ
jgi:YD repeat-containing protein